MDPLIQVQELVKVYPLGVDDHENLFQTVMLKERENR